MDQELRDYLEKQFKSIDERFDGVDERFDGVEERLERVETGVRENRVLIESLQGQIQLVAEGVAYGNERREQNQEEVAKELKEVRATMNLHYSNLDRRVKKLEGGPRPPKRAASTRSGSR